MGTKHTSTCLLKAADYEPIFVLRAQDKFSPLMVRIWAQTVLSLSNKVPTEKYLEAMKLAEEMENWHTIKEPT